MLTVLLVERDRSHRESAHRILVDLGCAVVAADSLASARREIARHLPDLVLCSVGLPDDCATHLLHDLDDHPEVEVALLADRPTVTSAIEAVRLGAFDYLIKPVDRLEFERVLNALGEPAGDGAPPAATPVDTPSRLGTMITVSSPMRRVFKRLERVAPTEVAVFVVGESGTGKEDVARTLHQLSPRREGPFLAVNCGALSPAIIESELFGHEKGSFTGADRRHAGFFERAHEGTLLLDEVTEMPADLQVKLLRVLETGRVTRVGGTEAVAAAPRIVAATNRSPEEAVAAGTFREDLYYRLKVFPIHLPPLRQRGRAEIELFARHFLAELNHESGSAVRLSEAAVERLASHAWPGNVRELRNVVRSAFVLADELIDPEDLGPAVGDPGALAIGHDGTPEVTVPVGTSIAEAEKQLIVATLDHLDGDKPAAAEVLGISLKTLYNRLKAYRQE